MPCERQILLACEDAVLLDQVGKQLFERGFSYSSASSLAEATAAVDKQAPDLIICSWSLGSAQVPELIIRLRRPQSRTRFIILAADGHRLDISSATRNRIVAYLQTPFDGDELERLIHASIESSENPINRREFSRFTFAVETHCFLVNPFNDSESRPFASIMRDVSRSGMAMLVRQVVPVPAMLRVTVTISDKSAPMTMLAKSISCTLTQIPDVYRLGVKFIGLLPGELERIVNELSARTGDQSHPDIFVGRSFKQAIREWLLSHKRDMLEHRPEVSAEKIVEELFSELIDEHTTAVTPPPRPNGQGRLPPRALPPFN